LIDRDAGKYSVWIDDSLKAADIAIPDTYEINALELASGHAGVKVFYDDVRVFESSTPPPSGQKPVAILELDDEVHDIGADVWFYGSKSYDPDGGRITSYIFDFDDQTPNEQVYWPQIGTTHQYSAAGEYWPRMKVVDDEGIESDWSTEVKVTVLPPPQLQYDVTVIAHCNTEGVDVSVSVWLDSSETHYTQYTFTGLSGPHTLTASQSDTSSHPFKQWSTGSTALTISVSSGGTYIAYYGAPPPSTYEVTVKAYCNSEGINVGVSFWLDSSMYSTPQTLTGLSGAYSLTASQYDTSSHPFKEWMTGSTVLSTSVTISINSGGTYTAYYEALPLPISKLRIDPDSPRPFGYDVTFDASQSYAPAGSIVSYNYNFGDTSTGWISAETTIHEYTRPGTFLATVSVKDDQGQISTSASFSVKVLDQIHGVEAIVTINDFTLYKDWVDATSKYTSLRFTIQENFMVPVELVGSTPIDFYWVQNGFRVYSTYLGYKMTSWTQIWHKGSLLFDRASSLYDYKNTVTLKSMIASDGNNVIMQNDFATWSFPLPLSSSYIYCDWNTYKYSVQNSYAPEIVLGGPGTLDSMNFLWVPFANPTSGSVNTYVEFGYGGWYNCKPTKAILENQAQTAETCSGLSFKTQTFSFIHNDLCDPYLGGTQIPDQGFWFEPDFQGTPISPPNVPQSPAAKNSLAFFLHCPAYLSIYDSSGNHAGYNAKTGVIDQQIPEMIYLLTGDTQEFVIFDPSGNYELDIVGTATGNYTLTIAYTNATQTVMQSFDGAISPQQTKYYSEVISSTGQPTPISWEYVFKDITRGTMLKISTDDKCFQFTAPDKDFGVKYDPRMFIKYGIIVICYGDTEMRLTATAVDGYFYYCTALAYDKQTRKTYALIDKPIGPRCLRLYEPL
jgi:hypothetical protein